MKGRAGGGRQSVTAGHLGGYTVGGDRAALYPEMWQWLIDGPEQVATVLDVGCGDGAAMDLFYEFGAMADGIDGVPVGRYDVMTHDFTRGPVPQLDAHDLVWSAEFVEHVEERYLPHMLPALCSGRLLAMTHAVPGQPGWHHVNCQPTAYWLDAIARYGTHYYDEQLTAACRELAAANPAPSNYFVKTGLVFRRAGT